MIEEKIITTPQELEKYVGKLIVTHYGSWGSFSKSLRILDRISNYKDKTSLIGCQIYGRYILRVKKDGTLENYFCCKEVSLYASNVEYVTLPTTEEKHLFMEKYLPIKLKNDYNICLKKYTQF
jgi:hypothetical protein